MRMLWIPSWARIWVLRELWVFEMIHLTKKILLRYDDNKNGHFFYFKGGSIFQAVRMKIKIDVYLIYLMVLLTISMVDLIRRCLGLEHNWWQSAVGYQFLLYRNHPSEPDHPPWKTAILRSFGKKCIAALREKRWSNRYLQICWSTQAESFNGPIRKDVCAWRLRWLRGATETL